MAPLTINDNTWDPEKPGTVGAAVDAQDFDYIVLQGKDSASFDDRRKQELEALKVEFHEYLGNNTYLRKYKPADLEVLRRKAYPNTSMFILPSSK